ncbi:MAG TPA: hypothetical protein VEO95_03790, partial [Chthoniobacteraceae bacterium]|nr:hypothetical protein [Chthoniobacteraceae bacterium]
MNIRHPLVFALVLTTSTWAAAIDDRAGDSTEPRSLAAAVALSPLAKVTSKERAPSRRDDEPVQL